MFINDETYEILHYPHPTLDAVAQPVIHFNTELKYIVNKMLKTMYLRDGCGLAANQINILQRIIVMDTGLPAEHPRVLADSTVPVRGQASKILINPIISWHTIDQQVISTERCLSFPDLARKMMRSEKIQIIYQDVIGKSHNKMFDNINAICIQHEIDHLNGITLASSMSRWQRQRLINKKRKQ